MPIDRAQILSSLGLTGLLDGASAAGAPRAGGEVLEKRDPSTGEVLGRVRLRTARDLDEVVGRADGAFGAWREVPAPARGQVVRALGDAFRQHKRALGALISMETGKPLAEGEGEVQEVVDIADFAVGLSRQLYGRSMHSERPRHRMLEQWHPLGPVAVITAFNFPLAVWGWNALVAAVCGDPVVWKPSLKAPLTALAAQRIVDDVLAAAGHAGVFGLILGRDEDVGHGLLADRRLPLVSATGSTAMGRAVQRVVHERFGRTLLELGGNNAVIVLPDADLSLAARAILFGAVGTAGQRCTSTRRVLCHVDVLPALQERLLPAYAQVKVGDPLDEGTHMGPLVDEDAVLRMLDALARIRAQGGTVLSGGGRLVEGRPAGSCFVEPTLVESRLGMPILEEEVFAPILHLVPVRSLEEAILANNAVPQGLSSALFTRDLRAAELFLSSAGSDCGIANVNLGTSGAEIGGAFGGEKETGGGREAGSDAWKAYMRRQTCTVNWGDALPLAQGIRFDVG